jgi:hypothetical protein
MVWTKILEIIADAAAIPPVVGVPEEICFTNNINMLEHYLDSNIELARKHASLTWVDQSFTIMTSNTIEALLLQMEPKVVQEL